MGVTSLSRPHGGRSAIPRWFVITEGTTEKEHIERLKRRNTGYQVVCLPIDGGAAVNRSLLAGCKRRLDRNGFDRKVDRAYMVLDQDARDDEQLEELRASIEKRDWIPIMTRPCFEYWLLLHFMDDQHVITCDEATQSLKGHWPEYQKVGVDHGALDGYMRVAMNRSRASFEHTVGPEGTFIVPIDRPFSMMHMLIEDLLR